MSQPGWQGVYWVVVNSQRYLGVTAENLTVEAGGATVTAPTTVDLPGVAWTQVKCYPAPR
jgi:hypothetical protein